MHLDVTALGDRPNSGHHQVECTILQSSPQQKGDLPPPLPTYFSLLQRFTVPVLAVNTTATCCFSRQPSHLHWAQLPFIFGLISLSDFAGALYLPRQLEFFSCSDAFLVSLTCISAHLVGPEISEENEIALSCAICLGTWVWSVCSAAYSPITCFAWHSFIEVQLDPAPEFRGYQSAV